MSYAFFIMLVPSYQAFYYFIKCFLWSNLSFFSPNCVSLIFPISLEHSAVKCTTQYFHLICQREREIWTKPGRTNWYHATFLKTLKKEGKKKHRIWCIKVFPQWSGGCVLLCVCPAEGRARSKLLENQQRNSKSATRQSSSVWNVHGFCYSPFLESTLLLFCPALINPIGAKFLVQQTASCSLWPV